MKNLLFLGALFLSLTLNAAPAIYDEQADAKADIQQALARSATNQTAVIVVFGANWCGDCRMLDTAMDHGTSAALLAHDFQVVKVNVGRFDKNVELAKAYGVPLAKGIPAVAILSSTNTVLYVTQ